MIIFSEQNKEIVISTEIGLKQGNKNILIILPNFYEAIKERIIIFYFPLFTLYVIINSILSKYELEGQNCRKAATQSQGSKSHRRYDSLVAKDHASKRRSPLGCG